MIHSGTADLPLHFGKVPPWLYNRMGELGESIIESVVQNYGKSEVLTRMSDPNWFQAFGAVMGMDWHSSGLTTAVMGSLRRRINPRARDLGLYFAGGKGKRAWRAPTEIEQVADRHSLNGKELVDACRLTRRVDNNAVQDGYNLYQQHFLLTDEGEWAVIQQGMQPSKRKARRYHWHSPTVRSFVDDPHKAIVGKNEGEILNLADSRAFEARENMVALTKEEPKEILAEYQNVVLPEHHDIKESDVNLKRLGAIYALAHDSDIREFTDLLNLKGVGPKTLRSLALVSEVIHGDKSRFEDPARFSFAQGGKDGVPFPVGTKSYDETIDVLRESIEKSKLGYGDKSKAIKRLHRAVKKLENERSPLAHLAELLDMEWGDAEKNGGMTFMGPVVKGLTRAASSIQNLALNGKR